LFGEEVEAGKEFSLRMGIMRCWIVIARSLTAAIRRCGCATNRARFSSAYRFGVQQLGPWSFSTSYFTAFWGRQESSVCMGGNV